MIVLGLLLMLVAQSGVAQPGMAQAGMASQSGPGGETRPRWNLRALHPQVRSRVHLHAADVPKFPHEIAGLVNPRLWPKTVTLKGKRCVLHVEGAQYGRSALLPRSIAEIESYSPFTLYYTAADGSSREEVGPAYMWVSPKQLTYRRFTETKGSYRVSYEYVYHEGGELNRYGVSRSRVGSVGDAGRRSVGGFQSDRYMEFFDKDGSLIGAGYQRFGAGAPPISAYYKEGKRVTSMPFMREEPTSGEAPATPSRGEIPATQPQTETPVSK